MYKGMEQNKLPSVGMQKQEEVHEEVSGGGLPGLHLLRIHRGLEHPGA